jgi:putative transposase
MPYWRLFYHIIWGTANREPFIQAEFEAALHNVIAAKAKSLGAFVYAVGGVEDHIHLVASIPPRIALSDFIGQVVVSFGGKQLDMVARYVKGQRQHHLEGKVYPFLECVEGTGVSPR